MGLLWRRFLFKSKKMKIKYYHTFENIKNEMKIELDKIWDDHLSPDPTYETSLVNIDVLNNPTICNAYSYQIIDDRIYYSIITTTKFKKQVFEFYESIINNYIFDFKIIDDHTYSVLNYEYFIDKKGIFIIYEQLLKFKDIEPIQICPLDLANDYFIQSIKYFNNDILEYYNKNKREILKFQTFGQGNCQLSRILKTKNSYAFDYFSVYERVSYTNYLHDIAQLLLDIHIQQPFDTFENYKIISNMLKNNPAYILFFILIQKECIGKYRTTFLKLFKEYL